MTLKYPVHGLILDDLKGLYNRPIEYRQVSTTDVTNIVMWDVLSEAPMSTQHANARFLVPHLAKSGWALFCDGDMLFRGNVCRVLDTLDPRFAVYCVKHRHEPDAREKMDGQIQTKYHRKNWSSWMIFNCDHPANKRLTLEMVNTLPGRDLHRFCWLGDDEIGELPPEWNYLVGYTKGVENPRCVHFTSGTPDMSGYAHVEYADEWRAELYRLIA